jgi:RNA polymerase sigma-70 factor (ECF subfamily)
MCVYSAPVPDEVLAARATGGCRDCFTRLYERYRLTLARYLHESFALDFDTALDLEAESWKRAFQHLATYGGERPFRAWLLAIPRHLALNYVRHRRRAPDPGALGRALAPSSGPLDQLERRESLEACVRLVRGLPPELREPFVLRSAFDLDVRSVAELLGIGVTTARGRLFRARKALVEAVREEKL